MIEINIGKVASKEDMTNNLQIIAGMIQNGYTSGCDPYWSITGDDEVCCDMCGEYFSEDELKRVEEELVCPDCYKEMSIEDDLN